jgi:TetR/AcrR family transcriptional repressor of bet genes
LIPHGETGIVDAAKVGRRDLSRSKDECPVPKIVDHELRRNEIALAACKAIAKRGLEAVTLADIAKEAGCTTGMLAHYYANKWDLVLGALRFMHVRLDQRLSEKLSRETTLTELLRDALPINAAHKAEAAAWLTFWGSIASRPELLKNSREIHADWRNLVKRCVLGTNRDAGRWPADLLEDVVTSIILFMDGLYVKALTCAPKYPPRVQLGLLSQHLDALLAWARARAAASRHKADAPRALSLAPAD